MKKIRKTKLLGVILCGLITSFMVTSVYKSIDPVFAQDESQSDGRLVFINGGLISLSGRIVLCGEGDSVVITVVDSKSNSALPEDSTEVLFMYETEFGNSTLFSINPGHTEPMLVRMVLLKPKQSILNLLISINLKLHLQN